MEGTNGYGRQPVGRNEVRPVLRVDSHHQHRAESPTALTPRQRQIRGPPQGVSRDSARATSDAVQRIQTMSDQPGVDGGVPRAPQADPPQDAAEPAPFPVDRLDAVAARQPARTSAAERVHALKRESTWSKLAGCVHCRRPWTGRRCPPGSPCRSAFEAPVGHVAAPTSRRIREGIHLHRGAVHRGHAEQALVKARELQRRKPTSATATSTKI